MFSARNDVTSVAAPASSTMAWRSLPPLLLVVAMALTAAATYFSQSAASARHETLVSTAMLTEVGRLQSRLDSYAALLRATRAFVLTEGDDLNRARFKQYADAQRLLKEYAGIRGLGYSPRVDSAQAAAFEAAARADGLAGFEVHPPGPRPWMFSILYLEPLDERNRVALGYDMFSDPVRAAAMARARDTGAMAMSAPVTLKQETSAQKTPGFLIYKPVYRPGPEPSNEGERRDRLIGFVYAPVRAGDFFKSVFDTQVSSLQVRVYAGSAATAQQLLFDGVGQASGQGASHRRTMAFGGQDWTLEFVEREQAREAFESYLPYVIAMAGTAITVLLFVLARLQQRHAARSALEARSTAVALEGERAQREVAQSLSELSLAFGSRRQADELIQLVTDESTRLTGAAFGAYFHNRPDEAGTFGLYALSGAPVEAFSQFPPVRPTALFAATFGGQTVRLDDVRESPLFGRNPPYNGMPEGHPPVASYLGVCVRTREGVVLGGLFLGHPEPGRFRVEHERLVEALAAQAAVVLENQALLQAERAASAASEEHRALLDMVIEQSGEGIIAADEHGRLRIFNPAAERQHGATRQEILAPDWAATYGLFTVDGLPLPLADTPLFRALNGEHVISARWCVHRPDGRQRTLTGTAMPLRRGDGSRAGAVLVTRDETERLEAEREREHLVDALSRSNQELDQFAYITSHDLKAPLRGIANLTQWMLEDLGPEEAARIERHAQMLQGRVHRMEALIDGILLYSRAGRQGVTTVTVPVNELLAEVVEMLGPPPSLRVVVDAPMPHLLTDRVGLQQCFMNLIGNAIKHAGREGGLIQVSAVEDGAWYRFSVKDDGPGIHPQYHERIWGIFQTLEARDKVEGTGIGLSIVRKIVQAHGGRAWIASAPGEGATFFFTWPKHIGQTT